MSENYCDKHNVDVSELPHDRCPQCEHEESIEAQEVELSARILPRSYDDPANIETYRR